MGLSENCEARGLRGFCDASGVREALPGRVVGPGLTPSAISVVFVAPVLPQSRVDFDQRRPAVDLGRSGGCKDESASDQPQAGPPSLAERKAAKLLHPSTKRQRDGPQSLLAAENLVPSEYRPCGDARQELAKLTSESVAPREAFLVHPTLRGDPPRPRKVTASPLRGLRRALIVRDVVPRRFSSDHR